MRFDPAWFLSGDTANTAAAEDGAVEPGQPVPNDNYVVEEGHRLLPIVRRARTSPSSPERPGLGDADHRRRAGTDRERRQAPSAVRAPRLGRLDPRPHRHRLLPRAAVPPQASRSTWRRTIAAVESTTTHTGDRERREILARLGHELLGDHPDHRAAREAEADRAGAGSNHSTSRNAGTAISGCGQAREDAPSRGAPGGVTPRGYENQADRVVLRGCCAPRSPR